MSVDSCSLPSRIASDVFAAAVVERHAFLFDLDGTLVDLAPEPDGVQRPPGLVESLARLSEMTGGAVGIITGRTLASADRMLAPLTLAGAGIHGLELRADPQAPVRSVAAPLPQTIRRDALRFASGHPGIAVEDKGQAIALHFRSRPDAGAAVTAFALELVERHAGAVAVQPGKMVVEIRPRGRDKGDAVREMMGLARFEGRSPVYFGDDLTDESAFAAAQDLGGLGILVGSHGAPTAAEERMASPAALRDALLAATGAGPARWL